MKKFSKIQAVAIALLLAGIAASEALAQTRAYVPSRFANTLSVIDVATNTVIATVPLEENPSGVAVTPDGAFVYISNANDGTVSVIDAATNTIIATVPVGAVASGIAITPDGAFAYVAAQNVVSVIDTATYCCYICARGRRSRWTSHHPGWRACLRDKHTISTVTVIDIATNTVVDTITVGDGPFAIAFGTRTVDTIGSLIAQVEALVGGGSLRPNQGAPLIKKLEQVQARMDNGQTTAACNQLSAFINQVNAVTRIVFVTCLRDTQPHSRHSARPACPDEPTIACPVR